MRSARSRVGKDFNLEERMAACAAAIESDPATWKGQWRFWTCAGEKRRAEPYRKVVLDLGCGKGEYTVACAKQNPDVLFVGLDIEPICVMRAAEAALGEGVSNAVFVYGDDPDLTELFAAEEVKRTDWRFGIYRCLCNLFKL